MDIYLLIRMPTDEAERPLRINWRAKVAAAQAVSEN
jgi:hypothetical protein